MPFASRERQAEYTKKYDKEYNRVNRKRRSENFKLYREINHERLLERGLKWQKSNPDKARASSARRRAIKRKATPAWVNHREINEIYADAVCRRLTVDHIVPLSHPLVCGLHVPWNLQLLTAYENRSKSNCFDV